MKTAVKTALGVDITQTYISMALLRKDSKGIKLIKAARCPVPEGTIKNGQVQEPAVLLKVLRELKSRNKIRIRNAALSLPADSVIMQILDLPKQIPANIGHFVQDEVKQYVALSGEKIVSDYCPISSLTEGNSRILVAVADRHKVAQLIGICSRAGIYVEAVEQPALSYIRACYNKKVVSKFKHSVLLALLFDDVLMLCVFRKQILDLVRTKNLTISRNHPQDFADRLAEEITAITQFYDIELPEDAKSWDITVVTSQIEEMPEAVKQVLKAKLPDSNVQIRSLQDAYQDTQIGENLTLQIPPSATAIGLAMRLISSKDSPFMVNLLPQETIEIRTLKRQLLVTANIVAAVLLLTMLIIHGLSATISKVNQKIQNRMQAQPPQATSVLAKQEKILDQQIQQLSEGPRALGGLISARSEFDWAGLLSDIRGAIPDTVCITRLSSTGNHTVFLEGLATSYEAANLFVIGLEKSEYVRSASLTQAQNLENQTGLIKYGIDCSLAPQKGKASDVN